MYFVYKQAKEFILHPVYKNLLAQSAGAVKYTDCTSAER